MSFPPMDLSLSLMSGVSPLPQELPLNILLDFLMLADAPELEFLKFVNKKFARTIFGHREFLQPVIMNFFDGNRPRNWAGPHITPTKYLVVSIEGEREYLMNELSLLKPEMFEHYYIRQAVVVTSFRILCELSFVKNIAGHPLKVKMRIF